MIDFTELHFEDLLNFHCMAMVYTIEDFKKFIKAAINKSRKTVKIYCP